MASCKTFLPFWIVSCVIAGKAKSFANLKCNSENHGVYGQQSLLMCVVQTAEEVTDPKFLVVTWKKIAEAELFLLAFNKGERNQASRVNFAEPDWDAKNMNVSLLVTNTQMADAGVYECMVMTDAGIVSTSKTLLTVTAKYSQPTIKSMPEKDVPVNTLFCNSSGGFPKGHIRWFDEHDRDQTSSSELEAKQTDDGLFNLSSKLTLPPGSDYSKYRCSVHNATGSEEGEATFETTDKLKVSDPGQTDTSKIVAPVVVIGSLIAGLLCAVLFLRRRSRRDHQAVDTHEPDVEGGGTGTEQL